MLIVVTSDPAVAQWYGQPQSNSNPWGNPNIIAVGTRGRAADHFAAWLPQATPTEAVCVVAHGDNVQLGDPDPNHAWSMDYRFLAGLLVGALPPNYRGDILFQVNGQGVANLSAHVALELPGSQKLFRVWMYGYNGPVPIQDVLPNPQALNTNVALQGTQVT